MVGGEGPLGPPPTRARVVRARDSAAVTGRVVVVGGGLAGASTVRELQAAGHRDVTLVGAEGHPPYDRPPLSKGLLVGDVDDTAYGPATTGDLDAVDVRRPVAAVALLPDGVALADGSVVGADVVVVATGARPLQLPADPGGDPSRPRLLRTVDDARALRADLVPGAHLLVVGAGWIGAEVATSARARGCEVTVLEAGPEPLAAALGPVAGGWTRAWWEAAGVALRTGVTVTGAGRTAVTTADGERLAADVVLCAVGVRPDVAWLSGSPVPLERGVAVDVHGEAAMPPGWPRVLAVGDCAARESPRVGRRLRVEHWDEALHAPEAVARTALGDPTPHDAVPSLWSLHLGHRVQHVGTASPDDELVVRGDPRGVGAWGVGWVGHRALPSGGRGPVLTAFLSVDAPRDALQARRRVDAGDEVNVARLADPAVAVRAA